MKIIALVIITASLFTVNPDNAKTMTVPVDVTTSNVVGGVGIGIAN